MKVLTLILGLMPLFASAAEPVQKYTNCRFSRRALEHHEITNKECAAKSCFHVVICGKEAKSVVCKAKSGGNCEANDANECVNNSIAAEADFDTK